MSNVESEPSTTGASTLIEGRLHPASILLQALKAIKRTAIYAALFAYQAVRSERASFQLWSVVATVVLLLMPLLISSIEWFRFRYRLTAEVLHVSSGVLRRKDRRIPVDRIQDLSSEAGILHRALGVLVLSVQTSSTQGAEVELDAISKSAELALRAALKQVTSLGVAKADVQATQTPEADAPLFVVSSRDLVLRGLTDNRAGLVLAGVAAVADRFLDVGGQDAFKSVLLTVRGRTDAVFGAGPSGAALLGIAALCLVWVAGWLTSAVVNTVRFHGFTLSESDQVFFRRYGLFTHRVHALPRRRVQCLRVEQTLLRRLVGLGVMRTDDMGAGAQEKSAQESGTDVFIPAASHSALMALVARVLPESQSDALSWQQTSARIIRRRAALGLFLGLALSIGGYRFVGIWSALCWLLVVPAALWGLAVHRTLRYARGHELLAVRHGVLSRHHAFVPRNKIQSLEISQTPFDRRHGVAKLRIWVGGGARVTLPNLPLGEARALASELSADPAT